MNAPTQRAEIAAQIMAALVAKRDSQSQLARAFDATPPINANEHFSRIAADAVTATDALLRQLQTDEPNTTT